MALVSLAETDGVNSADSNFEVYAYTPEVRPLLHLSFVTKN